MIEKKYDIKFTEKGICSAKGFRAGGFYCGIKNKELVNGASANINASLYSPNHIPKKNDVGIIVSDKMCSVAAVYTKNKVKGAPIAVTRRHIEDGKAQALIVNSKNANTCNADGEEKAEKMCEYLSLATGIKADDIVVASTGVIGQTLNIEPIKEHMGDLLESLSYDGCDKCATAMMTTDTKEKKVAVEYIIGGKVCHLGGIAKGSGMIHPNMATMLCFMTTDTAVSDKMLKEALSEVTKLSFNRVSVDGDTSTNDMALVMANGMAENVEIKDKDVDFEIFREALYTVMCYLSKEIARDGEGASKLLECVCKGASDENTAETVAKSVITSSLFKAAMFGEDANWGRVLCAIGYAPCEFDINKVDVALASVNGSIDVCKNGSGLDFSEDKAKTILSEDEIQILINLNSGDAEAIAWGCDLTYDYVKINGDYRS